jgi:hypothetical protein
MDNGGGCAKYLHLYRKVAMIYVTTRSINMSSVPVAQSSAAQRVPRGPRWPPAAASARDLLLFRHLLLYLGQLHIDFILFRHQRPVLLLELLLRSLRLGLLGLLVRQRLGDCLGHRLGQRRVEVPSQRPLLLRLCR